MEFFEDGHLELYNLKDDVGERNNLASQHPDKRDELLSKLRSWRMDIGAKLPKQNEYQLSAPNQRERGKKKSKKAKA